MASIIGTRDGLREAGVGVLRRDRLLELGQMWMHYWGENFNGEGGLHWIDSNTLQPGPMIPMGRTSKRISLDVDGNVWSVSGSTATRYNPTTQASDDYTGLTKAYTYSDMTGWALRNAHCKPEG